ncbi:hypothetical protein [Streptomyces cyaneofuscatus]|uniref:hypothetical protein n=1 Tax=Streptomyces cyaneofuscatus TaxID=66883 RepID=UPI0033AE1D60
MATRLTFLLDGRDHLSRVLDRAGDSANRMHRRISAAATNSSTAINRLGRTTTDRMAAMQRDTGIGEKAVDKLVGTMLTLAPAAIPMVASLAPIAPAVGAAAVAAGAYAAALGPQIGAMTEAAEAEKKYTDEVKKSGRTSEAAVAAQLEYQRVVADMPPETRRAAAALSVLKDGYEDWSNSLAKDTLAPVTKSFALLNGLLPTTSGLVRGTSRELDRTVTILAGGMESPGLDRLNAKFEAFATGTLRRANDGLVSLMRNSDGKVGAGLSEFMEYARANGPVAADTVKELGQALLNVLEAGSDVGVGMLQVVNVLAKLVASVPPQAIATMLQLAFAIKAVQLAAVGFAAARTAVAGFATSLVAMRVAAAGAPGRLSAVSAAIGTLSKTAKLAMAGTGIGLLLIAIGALAAMGKSTPPDVDRLTTSLGKLGQTGKASGEAARAFGSDLGGLANSLKNLADPSLNDRFHSLATSLVGMDTANVKEWKGNIDAVDQALANLVKGGKGELAAAALDEINRAMVAQGRPAGEIRGKLDEYKAALADVAFEQQLAAQSMGLLGTQAQQVQTKLDAQKASADGLRQSIQALNDVNRQGLGGMIGFESAIAAASKAAKENAGALSMSGGQLNLSSEKARTAATALNDLAAKTDEATASARQSGASWSTVNGIYSRGREKLLASAQAMGLTRGQAKALADQILRTPDKTARLKGNLEDLQAKLNSAKAKLRSVPDSRQAKLRAEISDLQSKVAAAKAAIGSVQGKTVSVMVNYRANKNPSSFAASIGGYASGGKPRPGELAWVGEAGPELVRFGSGGAEVYSHRSSMAMVADASAAGRDAGLGLQRGMGVSAGEVAKGGRRMAGALLGGITDELEIASPSKKTTKQGREAARGLAKGMRQQRAEILAEAKRMATLAKATGKSLIAGLTGSKSQISAAVKSLTSKIKAAWSARSTLKDDRLVARLAATNSKLQKLATARDKIAAKIAEAKKYAATTTATARQDTSLDSLGIEDGKVTAGGIKAGLEKKLIKLRQFTTYVNTLAKRGLSKTLLRQILDMGPEQGYAYANALAGASSSTIKSINKTQGALNKGTDKLGKTGADLLYDSGKNAAKGYLKGLDSQQDAIEKQMVKIAKAMDKAIRKALGIKSPSKVGAVSGGFYTKGVAKGAVDELPVLDRAMGAVAGRMATMRPTVGRPAVTAGAVGGGGQTIQAHITVTSLDPLAAAREVQKMLLQLSRTHGTSVTLKVG